MSLPQALESQELSPATVASTQLSSTKYSLAWAYMRHELLYICWALMDVALIAPAALAFLRWTNAWPLSGFIAWLLTILLIPFNLSRLMSIASFEISAQRRIIIGTFIIALFVTLRGFVFEPQSVLDFSWLSAIFIRATTQPGLFWRYELTLFALMALLWWRGLVLTRRHVSVGEVGFRMRLGGLILAPLVVILSVIPNARPAIPFVMLFFVASLTAIALTRAEEVSLQNAGTANAMTPRWVITVFAASLIIVTTAALAGMALSGRGWRLLVSWLSPLWNALALAGMVIVTTATYLLLYLLAPLQWLLRYLFARLSELGIEGLPELEPVTPELTDPDVDQLILELGDSRADLLLWANRVAIVVIVLLSVLILYVALRRYFLHRAMSVGSGELSASASSAADSESALGRRILNRLGRWRRWRVAATVRQLYRSMCAEADARGFPRAQSQTPYEYLPLLLEAWPDAGEDVALITDAYVRVRYGEIPEDPQELEALRSAWRKLARAPLSE